MLFVAACSSSDGADGESQSTQPTSTSAADESATTIPNPPATTLPRSTTTGATTTTERPIDLASGPSAGCERPEPTTLPTEIVTADGVRRTFRVVLPRSYDQTSPTPLVFDFHGLGSEGFQESLVSGVEFAADQAGYIAVLPDGAVNSVLGTRLWNLSTEDDGGALAGVAVDDVAFTIELLDSLETALCIDAARVFSMGLSNGGFFSSVLACELSDRIAAVASVAGLTHPETCDPVRPVPILHFHGTADNVVPFDGGESILTQAAGGMFDGLSDQQFADFADELFQPIEAEVGEWAEANGCDPDPERIEVTAAVERRVFDGCEGADVELYVIEDGGHTWPGSLATGFISSLGLTTFDISATQLAFDWFAEHPMPAE